MGVFSVSKIPYVFCDVFHNYISCGVVGICVVVCCKYADFLFMLLNGVTKLRQTWNYKQGWGTPNLGEVQSTHNPKTVFVFRVNLSHTTLCRLLFVISVYFTLYMLLFVFSHIKALCGLACTK